MTDPARYDAVGDQLVECTRGAAVRYKDWKAERDAATARVAKLALAPDDMLLLRVAPDYDAATVQAMAQALHRGTGRQVIAVSVDAAIQPLSPELSEAELRALAQHFDEDGTSDVTVGAFRAIIRRVMAMRLAT